MSSSRIRVEECPRCTTMKPLGARYHAPLLRERDDWMHMAPLPMWDVG